MPPRPPHLQEEHIEEILLRVPPNRLAGLFCAALVCRLWRRLICSDAFRRRYREFYRWPPMLAVLTNGVAGDDLDGTRHESRFIGLFWRPAATSSLLRVLDARHGRILLQVVEEEEEEEDGRNRDPNPAAEDALARHKRLLVGAPVEGARELVVKVPVTKEHRRVPVPSEGLRTLAAAVLCSDTTGACDHLDCHRGPFLVVLVACRRDSHALVYTYSSETATWRDPIFTHRAISRARLMPSARVGNAALYFGFQMLNSILRYDLQQLGQISWIRLPSLCSYDYYRRKVFANPEAGVLGMATIRGTKLHVWSRKDAPQVGDAGWTQTRVIELKEWLTVQEAMSAGRQPHVIGFVDGTSVILFWANGVMYAIDPRTFNWKKIGYGRTFYTLIPYMTFYTPALGASCTREGPSVGGSSS